MTTVSDCLDRVADLLNEHGFTTGKWPYDTDGLTFEAAVRIAVPEAEPTVLAEPGDRGWLRDTVLAELRPLFEFGSADLAGPVRERAAELRAEGY